MELRGSREHKEGAEIGEGLHVGEAQVAQEQEGAHCLWSQ